MILSIFWYWSYKCLGAKPIVGICEIIVLLILILISFSSITNESRFNSSLLEAAMSNDNSTVTQGDYCVNEALLCPSHNEKRKYYYTQLSNGLRVLLISDPTVPMASVSMNVAAGSFHDPAGYQGLAHFCEHMLFLGTKKYPDVRTFSKYVSSHGGSHNAFTSFQETTYFFEIFPAHIETALDIFGQFFVSPLFDAAFVDRELNTINEEHKSSFERLEVKWLQLLKHVSSRKHPFHYFASGDFTTLNKSDVRDQLIRFYKERYSANVMNLVIYSTNGIPELLKFVNQYFSDIPNSDVKHVKHSISPFDNVLGRILLYELKHSHDIVTIVWQTSSFLSPPNNKISDFIIHLLMKRGKGSLYRFLESEGLAFFVKAKRILLSETFSLFRIEVKLTDKGVKEISDVIKAVFDYMLTLITMSEENFVKQWSIFKNICLVKFDYLSQMLSPTYARDLSSSMRIHSNPADFLHNPQRSKTNFELFHRKVRYFIPENSIIVIGMKNIPVSEHIYYQNDFETVRRDVQVYSVTTLPIVALDMIEPIYSTLFTIYNMPLLLLKYWKYPKLNGKLYLPHPNKFIPDEKRFAPAPMYCGSTPKYVPHDEYNTTVEMWMVQYQVTNIPLVHLRCELRSDRAEQSLQWSALINLYIIWVFEALSPELHDAEELGYRLSFYENSRGVEFELSGLPDRTVIIDLIRVIVTTLMNENILATETRFDVIKARRIAYYQNFKLKTQLHLYLHYIYRVLLERPTWSYEDLLSTTHSITLDILLDFGRNFFMNDLNIACLADGHTDTEMVSSIRSTILHILAKRVSTFPVPRIKFADVVPLREGKTYALVMPSPQNDSNSAVLIIFQDDCFNRLRTVECLGYVILCFSTDNNEGGSFNIIVQSQKCHPKYIISTIHNFLYKFYKEKIEPPRFKDIFFQAKKSRSQSITTNMELVSDASKRFWKGIQMGDISYNDSKEKFIALDILNYHSFRHLYRSGLLSLKSRKMLTIVLYKPDHAFRLNANCIIQYHQINQSILNLESACSSGNIYYGFVKV